ncbi:hypothetical protein ACHMW7_27150 [Aminobacter sp. UC22_36]|uniref:hypothetical protein n=1 Tax=Aminobacter sp. UC22_36 TaxID=3374549 RepID=UPI003756FDE8
MANSRHGPRLAADKPRAGRQILAPNELQGNAALDATLEEISHRYGQPTADFVRQQLEYPRP